MCFQDFCIPPEILVIILFEFFIFFYILYKFSAYYKYNLQESKKPKTDYIKNETLEAISKFPSKWFDWLKWTLIIGALSVIEKQTPDNYLQFIIYVSYAAILLDAYFHIYNILKKYVEKFNASLDETCDQTRSALEKMLKQKGMGQESAPLRYIQYFDESTKILIYAVAIVVAFTATMITYYLIDYIVSIYTSSS